MIGNLHLKHECNTTLSIVALQTVYMCDKHVQGGPSSVGDMLKLCKTASDTTVEAANERD